MKIALIDDEECQSKIIKKLLISSLEELGTDVEQIDCFSSEQTFFSSFFPHKYDIIILDIYLKDVTGIDIARKIRKCDTDVTLTFCTFGNEFAAQSYEVEAKYYLNKPVSKEKLTYMLEHCNLEKIENNRTVRLPDGSRCPTRLIMYTEYSNHYVAFHINGQEKRIFHMTQRDVEKLLLHNKNFCVINKGCIVNFTHVLKIENSDFIMKNKQSLPIARRRFKEIESAYTMYRFEQMDAEVSD